MRAVEDMFWGKGFKYAQFIASWVTPHDARVESVLTQSTALATAIPLDGTTRRGNRRYRLPDGEYRVVMTVEKALADRRTPVETWTSPSFRIRRAR